MVRYVTRSASKYVSVYDITYISVYKNYIKKLIYILIHEYSKNVILIFYYPGPSMLLSHSKIYWLCRHLFRYTYYVTFMYTKFGISLFTNSKNAAFVDSWSEVWRLHLFMNWCSALVTLKNRIHRKVYVFKFAN